MRMIDADAFNQTLMDAQATCKKNGGNVLYGFLGKVRANLANFPTAQEVVRCRECKHRPKEPNFETYESGFDIEFPEGSKCPCKCSGDEYYSWYPEDNWFCADGERKDT